MNIYKITFQREIFRPRLAAFSSYLEVVTFIRACSIKHADEVAQDITKEHNFAGYMVEHISDDEFRSDMHSFLESDIEPL